LAIADDAMGEPLDDGGFSDTGVSNQDRVIAPSPIQNVDELINLGFPANHAVNFLIDREQRKVSSQLGQKREVLFSQGEVLPQG
jgi:hypothetical protein